MKKGALELARLEKATEAYAQAVLLIQSYHSPADWKTTLQVEMECDKIESESLRLDALKYQINIRTKGFGWKSCHHPWSKNGRTYTSQELMSHLVNTIFPFEIQHQHAIPINPCVDLPSLQDHLKLETTSKDAYALNKNNNKKGQKILEDAKEIISKHDYGHQF